MKKYIISLLLCIPLLAGAITAKAYVVMDLDGNVIVQKNPDTRRPIASITKLITAQRNADLPEDELITITEEDIRNGRMWSSPLRAGHSYTRRKLLELSLVNSDNVAAIALGRSSEIKADLPPNTTYVEASGLNPMNRSTAREIAEYANSMYDSKLAEVSVQPYAFVGDIARKNTNPLIKARGWKFFLSKTGFINSAGGCLVVITKIKEKIVTVAILGSSDTKQRWRDLAEIREQLGDDDFARPTVPVKKRKRR